MTSFALKIIAAASMLLDHMGLLIFPQAGFLRVLGRLAFPIYAFCIAEGFYHTRNKGKYFLQIFLLGAVCQLVYYIADGSMYLGVLITFSVSILLMWALERVKKAPAGERTVPALSFAALMVLAALLCHVMEVDYGFCGIMLPLLASISREKRLRLTLFALGLLALCLRLAQFGGMDVQWWSLCTLPLLWAYNGQPGKYRMKYFFYVFYPVHLAALYLIAMFI